MQLCCLSEQEKTLSGAVDSTPNLVLLCFFCVNSPLQLFKQIMGWKPSLKETGSAISYISTGTQGLTDSERTQKRHPKEPAEDLTPCNLWLKNCDPLKHISPKTVSITITLDSLNFFHQPLHFHTGLHETKMAAYHQWGLFQKWLAMSGPGFPLQINPHPVQTHLTRVTVCLWVCSFTF